ncbi:MAG: hypothetical protein PHI42_06190 [Paludibacteraceae bacterium]|nr:hypothetical protein [Paludibacteraceae bacterium]
MQGSQTTNPLTRVGDKSILHLESSTPGVTLELQIRRQKDVLAKQIGVGDNDQPIYETTIAKGEAVLFARFVGDISHLTNPAIAILHKRRRYHKKTTILPVEEEFDKKIEITIKRGWFLKGYATGANSGQIITIPLPETEGVWQPVMQVDEFVDSFRYRNDETQSLGDFVGVLKQKNRDLPKKDYYKKIALVIVSDTIYMDDNGFPRKGHKIEKPVYFKMYLKYSEDTVNPPQRIVL